MCYCTDAGKFLSKSKVCNQAMKGWHSDSTDPVAPETDDDDVPLTSLFPSGGLAFDEYTAIDDAVETCEVRSDSNIVEDVMASHDPTDATRVNNSGNENRMTRLHAT
jgi:hypothetical protein